MFKKKQKKSAGELEKKNSKLYDIKVLLQQSQGLSILSAANSPGRLGHPFKLQPNDYISLACLLSDVFYLMFLEGVNNFFLNNKSLKINGLKP